MARLPGVLPQVAPADPALARAGVLAVAPGPRGGAVLIHLRGRWLVVDEIAPLGARGLDTPTARRALDALLARHGNPARVRADLATPAGEHLAAPGVSIAIEPRRLAEALAWPEVAAAPSRQALELLRARCDDTAAVIARGPLRRLGATVDAAAGVLRARASWELDRDEPLAKVLAATTGGVLPRGADLEGVAASLHVYVAGWAPLARLPHRGFAPGVPPVFSPCLPALAPLAALYGWPAQIGTLIANLASVEPDAGGILAGLGEALLLIHQVADRLERARASVEVALDERAAAALPLLADGVWGPTTPGPGLRIWGTGRLQAFARGGDRHTGGLALGDAVELHLAHLRRASPPPAGTVAELRAEALPIPDQPLLSIFLRHLDAAARFDGVALRLDATAGAP